MISVISTLLVPGLSCENLISMLSIDYPCRVAAVKSIETVRITNWAPSLKSI